MRSHPVNQPAEAAPATPRVMVVDDDPDVLRLFESVLLPEGYDLSLIESGTEALQLLQQESFALVLTDLFLDEVSGLDLLEYAKQHEPETQVVLVTGKASLDSAIAALRGGATDYLTKPVDVDRLRTVVRNAVQRYQLEMKNRELVARLEEHQRVLQQRVREATHELAQANKRLAELAIHDGLTGLYNHRHFQERLDQEVKRADRYNRKVALLMLDLDHFKHFNDTYGHQEGNEALRTIAELLTAHVRQVDIVARYGGEEFAVIVPIEGDSDEAGVVAERIRQIVETTDVTPLDADIPRLTISIGYATYPTDAGDRNELIARADEALYVAKARGRNCVVNYADLGPQDLSLRLKANGQRTVPPSPGLAAPAK